MPSDSHSSEDQLLWKQFAEAQERARTTRAAVQGFRLRYGLGEAAMEPQPIAEGHP